MILNFNMMQNVVILQGSEEVRALKSWLAKARHLFCPEDYKFFKQASSLACSIHLVFLGIMFWISLAMISCSVAKSCLTLCKPMDCSTPGFPVLLHFPEFAQLHVHWVGDAIQPSYPLSSPSPPALNLSQHQGLFQHTISPISSVNICCSVPQSCPTLHNFMDCSMPGFPVLHHNPGACSNLRPLSWWCHPTVLSSVIPFSSCLQSFPASGAFPMSQLFASGGQSIGVSASVLSMNIQDWFPLGLTGLISLQSNGLSRVFSNITVQKHQFFST